MGADGRSQNWLVQSVRGTVVANTATDGVLSRVWLTRWQEAGPIFSRMIPGTTLLVTDLPAGSDTRSGPDFVVMTDDEMAG